MNITKQLETSLTTAFKTIPALKRVAVVAGERVLDRPTAVTLLIRRKSLGINAAAPQSQRDAKVLLTLISNKEKVDEAGDQLDPMLDALLDYLDVTFEHDEATCVSYGNRIAHDIPVTVIVTKD